MKQAICLLCWGELLVSKGQCYPTEYELLLVIWQQVHLVNQTEDLRRGSTIAVAGIVASIAVVGVRSVCCIAEVLTPPRGQRQTEEPAAHAQAREPLTGHARKHPASGWDGKSQPKGTREEGNNGPHDPVCGPCSSARHVASRGASSPRTRHTAVGVCTFASLLFSAMEERQLW